MLIIDQRTTGETKPAFVRDQMVRQGRSDSRLESSTTSAVRLSRPIKAVRIDDREILSRALRRQQNTTTNGNLL